MLSAPDRETVANIVNSPKFWDQASPRPKMGRGHVSEFPKLRDPFKIWRIGAAGAWRRRCIGAVGA